MTRAKIGLTRARYAVQRVQTTATIGLLLITGACASAPIRSVHVESAEQALAEAVRLRRHGRAFRSDSSVAEGLIVSLGQDRYKVGDTLLSARQLDSLYIRKSDDRLTSAVVLGAGIGALAGLFAGAILGVATESEAGGRWGAAGAAIGAGLAAGTRAAVADDVWVRRWPQGNR